MEDFSFFYSWIIESICVAMKPNINYFKIKYYLIMIYLNLFDHIMEEKFYL